MRPGRGVITTTRLARYTASDTECVTNIADEIPCGVETLEFDLHLQPRHLVQRAERFVEQEHLRRERQRTRHRHPHLHATRTTT